MKLLDFSETTTITVSDGNGGQDTYTLRAVASPADLRAVTAYRVMSVNVRAKRASMSQRIETQGPVEIEALEELMTEMAQVEDRLFDLVVRFLEGWSHDAVIDRNSVMRLSSADLGAIVTGILGVVKAMQGVAGDKKKPTDSTDS